MKFLVFGLNHKTAPIYVREKLALTAAEQNHLNRSMQTKHCHSSMLLSTCNRVEFYATTNETQSISTQDMINTFAEICHIPAKELTPHMYCYQSLEAIQHLFRVAASLDSMVVGEPQILGQLKEACESSRTEGFLQQDLQNIMQHAFMVAKKVRHQTGIARSVVSISSVAIRLAKQIFGQLTQQKVLLIGAGEMSELAAQHLKNEGVAQLFVANRSLPRATTLAHKLGGHPRQLDELPHLLTQVDIVIASTAARHYLVQAKDIHKILKKRKYRPIFFIDIAVPRNIDPAINQVDNIYLYDVDDLNYIAQENKKAREQEAEQAEQMVKHEVSAFMQFHARRQLGPSIKAVRQKVHALKEDELQWLHKHCKDLSADQLKVIRQFADRLSNKVLHPVSVGLKSFADNPLQEEKIKTALQLFAVDRVGEQTVKQRISPSDHLTVDSSTHSSTTPSTDSLTSPSAQSSMTSATAQTVNQSTSSSINPSFTSTLTPQK